MLVILSLDIGEVVKEENERGAGSLVVKDGSERRERAGWFGIKGSPHPQSSMILLYLRSNMH